MINNKITLLIALFIICIAAIISCTKEDPAPANPYDDVDYDKDSVIQPAPDPNTIAGLHKNIFSPRCAMPACHDGSFEPDYRTVQSAYSTLVYQPVTKNNASLSFKFRVLPYDTAMSWLHERVTTFDATLGQMPLYSTPLSKAEVQQITTWIMNGAKDVNGNIPAPPNNLPNIEGYVAFDSPSMTRVDSIRKDNLSYNPFLVNANQSITIWVIVSDDSTAAKDMQLNQMKMSLIKDDFSGAKVYNATYLDLGQYKLWQIIFNTGDFSAGNTVYLRYYCNDGTNAANAEFPRNSSPAYYKSVYAFYIQ